LPVVKKLVPIGSELDKEILATDGTQRGQAASRRN